VAGMTSAEWALQQLKRFGARTWREQIIDEFFWHELKVRMLIVGGTVTYLEILLEQAAAISAPSELVASLSVCLEDIREEHAQWLRGKAAVVKAEEKNGQLFWHRVRSLGDWSRGFSPSWAADWDRFGDVTIRASRYLGSRGMPRICWEHVRPSNPQPWEHAASTHCPSSPRGAPSDTASFETQPPVLSHPQSDISSLASEQAEVPSTCTPSPSDVPLNILVVLPGCAEDAAYAETLRSAILGSCERARVHIVEVESLQAFRTALVRTQPALVYFEAHSSEAIRWLDRRTGKIVGLKGWAESVLGVMDEWRKAEGCWSGLIMNTAGVSLPQTEQGELDAIGWAGAVCVPTAAQLAAFRDQFFGVLPLKYSEVSQGLPREFRWACSILRHETTSNTGAPLLATLPLGPHSLRQRESATASGSACTCVPGLKAALPSRGLGQLRMPRFRRAVA